MSAEQSIRKLLSVNARLADPQEMTRKSARVAWVRETSGALRDAQREMAPELDQGFLVPWRTEQEGAAQEGP